MNVFSYKWVIFLGLPLVILFAADLYPFEKEFQGVCSSVLDGDTIIVNSQKIRLAGIDAPEMAQKSFDGADIGKISKAYLKQRVLGKRVTIRYSKRGYYGRILGHVWLEGKNINLELLSSGMALTSNYTKSTKLAYLELNARLKRVGLFKTKGFESPWSFRKKSRLKKRLSKL